MTDIFQLSDKDSFVKPFCNRYFSIVGIAQPVVSLICFFEQPDFLSLTISCTFSDDKGIEKLHEAATWIFRMPRVHPMLTPILYSLPVQLLAYHTAKEKGTEIDQPRNLAKSVTVE